MKKTKLLLASLFLLLLGIAFSCKVDIESIDMGNNNLLKRARISVEERLKNDPTLKKYNIVPMWEKASSFEKTIELPFSMGGKTYRPFMKGNIENLGRARLLVTEQGNDFKLMIIHYMPSKTFKGNI